MTDKIFKEPETSIIEETEAVFLGEIGTLKCYLSRRSLSNWPSSTVALFSDNWPVKIFKNDYAWKINPNKDDKRSKLKSGSKSFNEFSEHIEEVHKMKMKDSNLDAISGYFIISNLLYDGYSFNKHLSWQSYLISRIGELMQNYARQMLVI